MVTEMTALELFYHPLSSYCHKVLVALYENATPFEPKDISDAESGATMRALWPLGKFPVLRDRERERVHPETSVIIEYLTLHYPGPVALVPADPELALEVRLWDRFFDQYVGERMSRIVAERIRPEGAKDPHGVDEARSMLRKAYGMLEDRMRTRTWAVGDAFTMADCAAAPALFYANIVEPFADAHPHLAAYFERLVARPSVARVLVEARPSLTTMFPYRDAVPARFLGT